MHKRYCDGCGKPLPEGEIFCPNCGGAYFGEIEIDPKPASGKKTFPVKKIVIITLSAAALCIAAVLIPKGGKEQPAPTAPTLLSSLPGETQADETNPTSPQSSATEPIITEPIDPENIFEGPTREEIQAYLSGPGDMTVIMNYGNAEGEMFGYKWHLYLEGPGILDPGLDVCGERVVTFYGTQDYIYYVKESEPTKIYRVDWLLSNPEVIYTSKDGELSELTYAGIDPMGKIYMVKDRKRVTEYNLATQSERIILELFEINGANVYFDNFCTRDVWTNELYHNVIYLTGLISEGENFSGVYLMETGEFVKGVRPSHEYQHPSN